MQQAFKFALGQIKPTDGVIVGILSKDYGEITNDARCARTSGVI